MSLPNLRTLSFHMALAAATLLAVGAIGWVVLDSFVMPRVARAGWPVVAVPDLTGLTVDEATSKLSAFGLVPVVDPERRKADHVGPDNVALQAPLPGDSVKKGHVVRIWLSAGPGTVPVPDISGQDSADAATHIQEAGLSISDFDWAPSTKVPAGKVVRTQPMNGTLLDRGATVKVVLSTGADPDSTSPAAAPDDPSKPAPRTF